MAVVCAQRALRGFVGPKDIFRNPQAIFCLFQRPKQQDESAFDLRLAMAGDDFAVMGMHFKLGMYEHQSAGAIAGLLELLSRHPEVLREPQAIERISITIYEPAFSIIGDPHKRDPHNRQSADHSMVYIIATLLRKAIERRASGWRELMLTPEDYSDAAIFHPLTRDLMQRIDFRHGGAEYDAKYPDGIPTTLEIAYRDRGQLSSGLVMYPLGHARHDGRGFAETLADKFHTFSLLGVDDPAALERRLSGLANLSAGEVATLYSFPLRHA
jgi:2-methylcitrate dehydratase